MDLDVARPETAWSRLGYRTISRAVMTYRVPARHPYTCSVYHAYQVTPKTALWRRWLRIAGFRDDIPVARENAVPLMDRLLELESPEAERLRPWVEHGTEEDYDRVVAEYLTQQQREEDAADKKLLTKQQREARRIAREVVAGIGRTIPADVLAICQRVADRKTKLCMIDRYDIAAIKRVHRWTQLGKR